MVRFISELLWLIAVRLFDFRPVEIVLPKKKGSWSIGCVIPIGDMTEQEVGMLRASFDARRVHFATVERVIAGRTQQCLTVYLEHVRGEYHWESVYFFTKCVVSNEVFENMFISVRTRRYDDFFGRLGQKPRTSQYLPVTPTAQES